MYVFSEVCMCLVTCVCVSEVLWESEYGSIDGMCTVKSVCD